MFISSPLALTFQKQKALYSVENAKFPVSKKITKLIQEVAYRFLRLRTRLKKCRQQTNTQYTIWTHI